jgi:hypothetical protein
MKIKSLYPLFSIIVILTFSAMSISALTVFATSDDSNEITCNTHQSSMGAINHMGGTCQGDNGGIIHFGGSTSDSGSYRFHTGFHR